MNEKPAPDLHAELLARLGVQGHEGAINEIESLRTACGLTGRDRPLVTSTAVPLRPTEFERELEDLINRHSQENGSNTPDHILACYLTDCLTSYNRAVTARELWYGRKPAEVSTVCTSLSLDKDPWIGLA